MKAQFYDDMRQRYGHLDAKSPAAFHRRRIILELACEHASRSRSILEVGCGQGHLLAELGERFPQAQLFGADVSEASRAETARNNPRATVFALDIEAQNFRAQYADRLGKFDLIVCAEVIEYITEDELALANLRLLLAPDGYLLLTVPRGRLSRFDEMIGHQRHYDPNGLERLLGFAGLEVTRLLAWGFPFQNLYRSAVRIASRVSFRPAPGQAAPQPAISSELGHAYELFGAVLKPLFYLNRPYWGEQLFVLARPMSSK